MAKAIQTKEEIMHILRQNAALFAWVFGLKRVGLLGPFVRGARQLPAI